MRRTLLAVSLLSVLTLPAAALAQAPRVQVVGLFPNAAVLNIDGVRKLLKVGQTGPYGIQVLSANAREAVLLIDGAKQTLSMSREYNPGGYAVPQKQQISIPRGQGGHYWSSGSINGKSVQFLIDTGASNVAISELTAQQLGIDYKKGDVGMANTAAGAVPTWNLRLQQVTVGGITLLGVDATVMAGNAPVEPLLGMSYLSRVGWREEQGLLYIESRQ